MFKGGTGMIPNYRYLVLASLFALLTAVGAFLRVPFPLVPLSLQTFMVLLSGLLLGSRYGSFSQLIYLAMGLLGLPVFAGGGGIHYIFHPTFGFLAGFLPGAYLAGRSRLCRTEKVISYIYPCLLGTSAIYLCGITYLYLNLNYIAGKEVGFMQTLKIGMLPFLAGDLFKILGASFLASRIIPALRSRGFISP